MFRKVFIHIFKREIERIWTNKDLRLMCFVAPVLYGIVLTSTYYQGRLTEIPIGTIDQDQSQHSRTLLRNLDATENIHISKHYETSDEANDDILKGEIEGFIVIPRNFSNRLKLGLDSTAFVSVSSSNFMISTPVLTSFSDVVSEMSGENLEFALNKKGYSWKKGENTKDIINLRTDIAFNPALNYSNFMIPALLYAIIQQVLMVALAFTFVEEREKGNLPELLNKTHHHTIALILGKSLPYVLLNFIMSVLFTYTLLPFFGLAPQSSFGIIVLTSLIFITAITSWGLWISTFFKTTTAAMIALMFYSMPTFLFSGVSWPLTAMNLPIKIVRFFFPSTYFLTDIRIMVLAQTPFKYFVSRYFIMILFTLFSFGMTYLVFKRWHSQSKIH